MHRETSSPYSGVNELVRRIAPHAARLVAAYTSHLAAASPEDVRFLRAQPAGKDPARACNMTAAALAWVLSGTDAFLPYTFDWGVRVVAASSEDGDEFGNAVEHVALFVGTDTVFDSFFMVRKLGERTAQRSRAEDYSGGLFVRHVPVRVLFTGGRSALCGHNVSTGTPVRRPRGSL